MRENNQRFLVLGFLLTLLILSGLACNLFASPAEEEIVEEVPIVEEPEPESEPTWAPELLFRLEHDDLNQSIGGVAYTRDGSQIGTSAVNEVYLWNAADGTLNRNFSNLPINGKALGFSFDDQAFATTTSHLGVVLIDAQEGETIHNFHRGYDSVLDFSPDGTLIVTGTRDGVVWLFDVSSGDLLIDMDPDYFIDEEYFEWLTAVAFAPNGKTIASGHWDGRIFIWDATPDSVLFVNMLTTDEEFGNPYDLAFSVDSQYLAAAGGGDAFDDAWVLRIWNVTDGSLDHSLPVSRRNEAVAFSPDGTLLAAGDREMITLWSLPDFDLLHQIPNPEPDDTFYVTNMAFSPDSQHLAAGYSQNFALVWQVQE